MLIVPKLKLALKISQFNNGGTEINMTYKDKKVRRPFDQVENKFSLSHRIAPICDLGGFLVARSSFIGIYRPCIAIFLLT